MIFIPILFLVLYLVFSACDSIWAERRAQLKDGKVSKEGLNQRLADLYTQRFRLLKFCLMPLLLAFYLASALLGWPLSGMLQPQPINWLIVLALICGWAGDVLLEVSPKLFPAGLGSFLAGHIFYIIAFARPFFQAQSSQRFLPLILCFVISVFYLLFMIHQLFQIEDTRPLRIPLGLYLGALVLLFLSTSLRFSYASPLSACLGLLGAILFTTSDTILSFRMFKGTGETGIMETYTAAQFLLVLAVHLM
ncbi:MAG: lysoplasmalogenase [Firmicutes bacterium]|nr:lysoplasmalogenase [Bacillota bacterium]